jgi:hypothetical protein
MEAQREYEGTADEITDAELWKLHKEARQIKRQSNRERGAGLLQSEGIGFEIKNDGAHLIIKHGGRVVDFWPGTGKWIDRAKPRHRRGVFDLLEWVKT